MTFKRHELHDPGAASEHEKAAKLIEDMRNVEDPPLILTMNQRARLWDILRRELGPMMAHRLMPLIERNV